MNIKAKLRAALLAEGENKRNKFGCVMIYLNVDKKDWKKLQDAIDEEDLYLPKGEEDFFGREPNPHATILFGLHNDIPDEDIEEEINKIKFPKIQLGKVSSFTNEKFDVLKFDIKSEDLNKLNKKFSEFPHTQLITQNTILTLQLLM
jgi:tRNA pseudouridine-54 N-methylase